MTAVLYPQARHEILNETNRDEVTADLLAWLDRVTAPDGAVPIVDTTTATASRRARLGSPKTSSAGGLPAGLDADRVGAGARVSLWRTLSQ